MNQTTDTSALPSQTTVHAHHRRNVNWHEAATCAIEIDLRDYTDLLEFLSEYNLGKNNYRIDILVIKKLSNQTISKNIARIFRTYNLFECKGIHSSLTINAYYKTIGYAGLLIDQLSTSDSSSKSKQGKLRQQETVHETEQQGNELRAHESASRRHGSIQYTALNVSLTFLTFHYPRKLIKHLTKERNLTVAKFSDGIYYISIETFDAQIIVTSELPSDENLYLRCLTDNLTDTSLINRLADDYSRHLEQEIYIKYMNQLTNANMQKKGESPMVCEGLLNLCGTSSAEIIAKAKKESDDYYLPKINELSASVEQLSKRSFKSE